MPQNTEEKVSASISSIYDRLLEKRIKYKEEKEAEKIAIKEAKMQEKLEEESLDKESKKALKEEKFQAWKAALSEITGEDLDYKKKKNKKHGYSYKKWYEIEMEEPDKPKKKKKKNYNKEFESELKMLRMAVAEQNRFNSDLQKRFQNALGPATKDAQVPNKSMVDLAAAINSGRSNTLGIIREIANIKKNIADLTMKDLKLQNESNTGTIDSGMDTDLSYLGSSIRNTIISGMATAEPVSTPVQSNNSQSANNFDNVEIISNFDPNSWNGAGLASDSVKYENTPYEVMVEMDNNGNKRFVAIDNNGNELNGCNMPTSDPSTLPYDPQKDIITGTFGEAYKVKHV